MASTFTSDKTATGEQARAGLAVETVVAVREIAAALVVDDVIQMVPVPEGATILDILLAVDDLDTDGSPAIVLDVGDGDNDDRFIAASTIGQAGGAERMSLVDGIGYQYSSADTIDVSVKTAPATGATTGTIKLVVSYTMA